MYNTKMLIGGELVEGDAQLDVINPATGRPFITVGRASVRQLDQAVAAARAAQPKWAGLSQQARRDRLIKFADAIHERSAEIARAITLEQGKPLLESAGEVALSETLLRSFADMEIPVETLQDDAAYLVQAHHRPLGVVAGITPWNFPIAGLSKLACAVVTGNTFIWKPAPTTPVAVLILAEIARDIFPPGVVNVIIDQNDLGAALSSHPGVNKISFTGSTATGKKIMKSASEMLTRFTLELGGNDAAIVLEDADVDVVAARIFGAAFYNAGQICIAVKRVYAHSSLYDRLCDELAKLAKAAVVGDGTEQGVQIGPLQNAAQFEKARNFLAAAAKDGTIVAGGSVIEGDGYFIQPTIVRDIREDSILVQDEQFSPILPVLSFDDVDDVVERANGTPFGLGGSVWSRDIANAKDVAERIDSGTVWVNQHLNLTPAIPFGGAKQSGFGVEFGQEGLAEFTQLHVVNIARA
jgi:aldehyde dehydrogenase (NAD+)